MRASVIAAALLAACAQAIQITAPTKNQTIDLAEGFEVKWDTVSSDPTSAHLFIVNMAGGGEPFSKDLGEVDLTKGGIKVTDDSVPNGEGYQFNLQSVTAHNTGILAQSQQFKVKSSPKKSTTTTKSASASATASASASASDASASESSATTLVPSASKTAATTGTKSSTTAVPTGAASSVKGGSLLALAMGVLAVVA